MIKTRTKIYLMATPKNNEIVYSGIDFSEFITHLSSPIENILLLKGDFIGNRRQNNFDLVEGREHIEKLKMKTSTIMVIFCFIDYLSMDCIAKLSSEQVAELLYLAHMYSPLKTPFIDALQNRFVYLAHDDGYYCKLYSQDPIAFITVLCNKIIFNIQNKFKVSVCKIPINIKEMILELATKGLFIDLEDMSGVEGKIVVKLYTIGMYTDMDIIFNNYCKIKHNALIKQLNFNSSEWIISNT